jgi:hypothetical protein
VGRVLSCAHFLCRELCLDFLEDHMSVENCIPLLHMTTLQHAFHQEKWEELSGTCWTYLKENCAEIFELPNPFEGLDISFIVEVLFTPSPSHCWIIM